MSINFKNHLNNFSRYQKFALHTQIEQLFPKLTRKKRNKLTHTVANMINNIETFNKSEECTTEDMLAIVDTHRSKLGLEPYATHKEKFDKYYTKCSAAKQKKGKGRKKKPAKPKVKIMSDDTVAKDPMLAMAYFHFCLRIQEQEDNTKRFHLVPQWKCQHGHATIGNAMFYHLVKKYGDDDDRRELKRYKCDTFCNHPNKRKLWAKYFDFEQYECDNNDQKRVFNYQIQTDGISIVFNFKTTFLNDTHNNPRAAILPEPRVPEEETDACKQKVGFGMYAELSRRSVVEDYKNYTKWCIKTASAGGAECCPQMRDFANYATDRLDPPPPPVLPDSSVPSPKHDDEDATLLRPWWKDSSTVDNLEENVFRSTRDNTFTTASLRGKLCMCCLVYYIE